MWCWHICINAGPAVLPVEVDLVYALHELFLWTIFLSQRDIFSIQREQSKWKQRRLWLKHLLSDPLSS